MGKQKEGGISWTNETWNPLSGCTKVSPGCKNCYAETIAERFRGTVAYPNGFDLTLRPERLDQPLRWQKPRMIFVNSMSDLFHKDVPASYIGQVFEVMNKASNHTFQVLTKRPELMSAADVEWTFNIWAGTSVENDDYTWRVSNLRAVNAKTRFLSIEPMLGEIKELDLTGIHWVICGGESGTKARPMNIEWARRLRDICKEQNVIFHFKQWGEYNEHGEKVGKVKAGHLLDGVEHRGIPARGKPLSEVL